MNNKLEYVWISKLEIPYNEKIRLLNEFGGLHQFFNSNLNDLIYYNTKEKYLFRILDNNLKEASKKEYDYMQNNDIDIIGYDEKEYPSKLNNIYQKPICFYLRGCKEILNEVSIGVVGSRIAKNESLKVSRLLSQIFASNGVNVISGLAIGIDKYAHLGALDVKGKTVAVLGNGIDEYSFYPQENKKVYERIIENRGAVISEYPLFTKPYQYNFPYRNRIISGLSDKIFVIQASKKSGSLITVDYAIDQGKDIYVYKSKDIEKESFEGNKTLIEEGANYFKFS